MVKAISSKKQMSPFDQKNFKDQIKNIVTQQNSWQKKQEAISVFLKTHQTDDVINHVIDVLFQIIDQSSSNQEIGVSAAILTEIAKHLSNRTIQIRSIFTRKNNDSFVNDITSQFLSRSNINNNTVRLGIVHYLSEINPLSKNELGHVLQRFGESLLKHTFQTYFSSKKESHHAFFFLKEHLDQFLSLNPLLAEMSAHVLQQQMLKNADAFPKMLKTYLDALTEKLDNNPALIRAIGIHLSFLMKTVCDIEHKQLIDQLLKIIISFASAHEKGFPKLRSLFLDVVSASKTQSAKETIALFLKSKPRNSTKSVAEKSMHATSSRNGFSPLDEVLFLAS